MTAVAIGGGITPSPVDIPAFEAPEGPPPAEMPALPTPGAGLDVDRIKAEVRAELRGEMDAAVADIERRLAQARELERSALLGEPRQVHAEDLNISKFMIDGYTLTANSPSAGFIAWANLHVVFMGVDYTITNGNTDKKYAWFVKPASGTDVTMSTGDTLPALGPNDALLFVNNAGVPVSVLESSVTYAVGPGVIGNDQLAASVQQTISTLQANDIALQSALDGAITTWYQNEPPHGTVAGPNVAWDGDIHMGDVWYDSNDGGAYRWTGAGGTPANTWQRIADTDTSAIAAKVNTKTTTYLAATTAPPVAPAGGFTTGDLWMKTNQNNLLARWSGSGWVDLQLGDAAIASGISGAKIGSGIDGANVTTGTVAAARIGAGVNGAVLGTATGTVGSTQIAANAITPPKINAAFHLLY